MKFGTLYSYWGHEWKCDYIETAKRMKKCGCEVLEVGAPHLLDMTDEQLKEMLTFANAAASIITTRKGALRVMPTREEVLNFLKKQET